MNSPRSPVAGFRLCPLVTPPTTSLCPSSSNRQLQGRDPLPLHLPIYLSHSVSLFLCVSVYKSGFGVSSGSALAPRQLLLHSFSVSVFQLLLYIFIFLLWFVFVYALKCLPWTHARLGERKSRWERADNIDNVWRGWHGGRRGEKVLELPCQCEWWAHATDGQGQGQALDVSVSSGKLRLWACQEADKKRTTASSRRTQAACYGQQLSI